MEKADSAAKECLSDNVRFGSRSETNLSAEMERYSEECGGENR